MYSALPEGKLGLAFDQFITPMCIERGSLMWDRDYWESIPEVHSLGPGDTVLDVGAYIGDTTAVFLAHGCRVHAFECQGDALLCLKHNCPDAVIHDSPVGDGTLVQLYEGASANAGARFVWSGTEGLVSIRIDDLNLEPDFIKIDVEGWEPKVLDGAIQTLKRFRPVLHIEVNDRAMIRYGWGHKSILNRLEALGYAWRETSRYDPLQYDIIALPEPT